MAIAKVLVASLLISLLALQLVDADEMVGSNSDNVSPSYKIMDCGSVCQARCQLSSRQTMCLRACGTCCARCNCVPQGTSGNEDVCPCYATMTTHDGRHKCP